MRSSKDGRRSASGKVTLKDVARRVGLTPGTVSAVLNETASATAIPADTKERVFAAARQLNYSPNFFARSLRKKRTFTVGVITEEIGDPYGGMVISGIESFLSSNKYFFITVAHRHKQELLEQYADMLRARGVEGLITIDTSLAEAPPLPTVAVAGHRRVEGVTNIVLDHDHAARTALQHLQQLGHRDIVFMKGQAFSSDSEDRWRAIVHACGDMGIPVRSNLILRLDKDDPSPRLGYEVTRELLADGHHFTALFAYNDISAMGAIRALGEAGLRVPSDVSVVGFDDIRDAAYHVPALTTVAQPLRRMGEIAAEILVERIEGKKDYPKEIAVVPELVIRETTAAAVQKAESVAG